MQPATPPPGPSRLRGVVYLVIAILFAAGVLASMWSTKSSSTVVAPCTAGAVISQAAIVRDATGAAHMFAVVRPPSAPNVAPGNEPGCDALYRSDDGGTSWTAVFSATAEAPLTFASTSPSQVYLLTQRVQFPTYVAGNIYGSDTLGDAWTWKRISPQGRHAAPMVSITDMLTGAGGSLILRAGNADGAALLRSVDRGATWHSVVVPDLVSTTSVAALGNTLAVAPGKYTRGTSPGKVSTDGGATWSPLGLLPASPPQSKLHATLSASEAERALILELMPTGGITDGPVLARYSSIDGGRTWTTTHCGAQPAPGCASPARWAQTETARYVFYHQQLFAAKTNQPWRALTAALPVPSNTVLQLLAVPAKPSDLLYLVTGTGIWELRNNAWRNLATNLGLAGPSPVQG
ncbi:MAG: repeat-like domain [Chloroflexi bacterium]|nr:repeat-like domain [Chloroflexota bacterium]